MADINKKTEYHRGLGLISMDNGINERFYRYDALGSMRALSDGNSVTDTYDYVFPSEFSSKFLPNYDCIDFLQFPAI
jgi:hypothetical protein